MGDFEKLKSISVNEIYNQTYVAHDNIEALLNKDFSKLTKFKVMGFIKIIEKEFKLDLSDLKKDADIFYKEDEKQEEIIVSQPEITTTSFDKKYLVIGILILFGLYFVFNSSNNNTDNNAQINLQDSSSIQENEHLTTIDQHSIEDKTIVLQTAQMNEEATPDLIIQEDTKPLPQEENSVEQEKAILPNITIEPKQQIWVGFIYLDDYSKKDYLTSRNIDFDNTKNQLIITGHGHMRINIDGDIKDYSDNDKQRFLYQDGKLESINMAQFKELNQGRHW